jgi:hypothetical protein
MKEFPVLIDGFREVAEILPRRDAFGLLVADVLVMGRQTPSATLESAGEASDSFHILRVAPAHGSLVEAWPTRSWRVTTPTPPSPPFDRAVDAFLAKYRLKHHKKWVADELQWVLQTGHARKIGLFTIAMPRSGCGLRGTIGTWPEPHVWRHLAGDLPIEILLPEKNS